MMEDQTAIDAKFMAEALREAEAAAAAGEVPVGAVIVVDGAVVARARNQKEATNDPTDHAEIVAVRRAAEGLATWRLSAATLYVTLEPCAMCAGALVQGRISRLVYGCRDPKAGAVGSLMNLCQDPRLNHRLEVTEGVLAAEASEILKGFFRLRRKDDSKRFGELAELVEGA